MNKVNEITKVVKTIVEDYEGDMSTVCMEMEQDEFVIRAGELDNENALKMSTSLKRFLEIANDSTFDNDGYKNIDFGCCCCMYEYLGVSSEGDTLLNEAFELNNQFQIAMNLYYKEFCN